MITILREGLVTSQNVVSAGNLAAGYPGNVVWRDADFEVNRGEFVAVIGPNGSGKTTLFRLLLGLQKPLDGTLKVFDHEPKKGNRRIGYVPQRHTFDGESNVESLELVQLGLSAERWGLSFSKDDRKTALRTLNNVGATELAHRSLGDLSGGELQRVFLAEALVSDPEILLLDEPLSNLDIRREKELLHVVNGIVRKQSVTAILIAHNINPLLPFLDKVVYIANGKIATGRPNEVLTSKVLSALYGVQIEVLRDTRGNVAIIGIEDSQYGHEIA